MVFDHCAKNFGDLEIFEDGAGILDTVANHNIRFRASNNGFLSPKLPRAAIIAAAASPYHHAAAVPPPCHRRAIAATMPCHPTGHQATVAPPPPSPPPPYHRRASPRHRRAIAATMPCLHQATMPPSRHRRAVAATSVAPSGRPDVRSIFDDIKIDLRNMLSLAIYDFKDKIIARCDTSIN